MQAEEINQTMKELMGSVKGTIDHLQFELSKVRTGKASPTMLADILIDYYGSMTPLNQVANISTSDARTLSIQPWEKSMLGAIERAIFEANLGVTPMNDGEQVRLNIPPLTEERRRELVKQAKSYGEDAKISLRSARHKVLDAIKKSVKNGYSEDAGKDREKEVQDTINEYSKKIDHLVEAKEKDVMTV
ncbi:MAG: ribosome recycling factor [Saprospiraceae bacterium]|nr:MAG: ribosome recycling factor [Saprospiraceae bacterium]